MTDRWYYQLGSEEHGPVDGTTVLELHQNGTLAADALVRSDDAAEWRPLSECGLLADVMEAGDLTDLSELSFEFEESAASTAVSASAEAEESDVVMGDAAEIGDLSELSFEFEENATVPARRRQQVEVPADPEPEEQEDCWYQSLGQTLGPMVLADLVRIAEQGGIHDDDLVRIGEQAEWRPASEVDEVSAAILSSRFIEEVAPASNWISPATTARLGNAQLHQAEEDPQPAEQRAAEPAQKQSAKPSTAKQGSKSQKRRRRRKSEDAVLSEIFDEVFTEEEEPAAPRSAGTTSSTTTTTTSAAAAAPAQPSSPAPQTFSSASAGGAAGFGSPAGYSAPARPPYSSPSPPRRSSGGGFSFDISGGAVVGILSAVLLIGAITGVSLGWISLPSIGTASVGSIKESLKEYYDDYKTMMASNPSPADWGYFGADYVPSLSDMMADAQSQNSGSEADKALQEALGVLIAIVSTRMDETERRGRLEERFEALLPQL